MVEWELRKIKNYNFPSEGSWREIIEFLLQYAASAPSTHNSQPWLCEIKDNVCIVFLNNKIQLPESDPMGYYAKISLGCFIENFVVAANYFQIEVRVEYSKNENSVILECLKSNVPLKNKINLFDQILKRKNVRGVYQKHILPNKVINNIQKIIPKEVGYVFLSQKNEILQLSRLTSEAICEKYYNKKFRNEMSKWIRPSITRKKDGLYGANLRAPFLLSFLLPFLIKYFNVGKVLSKLNFNSIKNASGGMIFSLENANFRNLVSLGRVIEKLFLYLNFLGYKHSIFVAALETDKTVSKLKRLFQINSSPYFIFVFGKMEENIPFSKRHMTDCIINN